MDQNAKQQAVEQVKRAANVLVTVSANPSVDQLSAALGLTLMLNKMGKHTTAVVSGAIPPAISFLDPSKTFTNSVDSLRDFIIALDKDKADKLRYKVEDDVVRIFITPYDGEITKDDLKFSQGDFNVDVVVALGVTNREDIDTAIKAHGRILHDATVITINAGAQKSSLGAVDWQDINASSLSEMMVSVSEAFQGGLLDTQISTALLTGIDAATERFSNSKTSPKIMTMAAQLMAAGANQQLIANNLEVVKPAAEPSAPKPEAAKAENSELKLDHTDTVDAEEKPAPMPLAPPIDSPPPVEPVEEILPPPTPEPSPVLPPEPPQPVAPPPAPAPSVIAPSPPPPVGPAPGTKTLTEIEEEVSHLVTAPPAAPPAKPARQSLMAKIKKSKQARLPDQNQDQANGFPQDGEDPHGVSGSLIGRAKGMGPKDIADKPLLGGTFNATSVGAHEDAERAKALDVNNSLLDHDRSAEADLPPAQPPAPQLPALPGAAAPPAPAPLAPEPPQQPAPPQDMAAANTGAIDIENARKAVEQAVVGQPFDPANHPIEKLASSPMGQDEGASQSTEINIDPNGNLAPAAQSPVESQTLAIPTAPAPAAPAAAMPPAAPPAGGMPPLATDSLDASPPLPPPPLPPPAP